MKLKKALVLIFVFMVGFLAFNKEVFAAAKKIGNCWYEESTPIGTDFKVHNAGFILFDDGTSSANCFLMGSLGASCNESTSSLLIYDSSEKTFYCPDKIYLNKDSSKKFSFAREHRTEGNYFVLSKPSLIVENSDYKVKAYEVAIEGNDKKLRPCVPGGTDLLKTVNNGKFELRYTVKGNDNKDISKKIVTSVDELSQKNRVNGASAAIEIAKINAMYKAIVNDYYIKVDDRSHPKYCAFLVDNNNEKTQQKLNQLNEALNHYQQIVNTSAELTKEQKKEATRNATSAKNLYKNIIKSATITPYNPGTTVIDCGHLIDEDLKAVIQLVLKWVRIGAPILLIILMSVDFGQAVISQDQDAMKKATSKAIKRAVAAVALFFIPLLVSIMINWIDSSYFDKNASNCEEVIK